MTYKVPISVIMPLCNNALHISKSIESILNQSYQLFELIIISNTSNLEIENEIKRFGDSRIIYIKNKTLRCDNAIKNLGLKIAVGKYICMMDSNCIAVSNRLELQYNYLESYLNVGCIGGNYEFVYKNNIKRQIIRSNSHASIKTYFLKSLYINESTIMIRSHLLKKHNLYFNENHKYSAAYNFFIKASRLFVIKNLNKLLVQYIDNLNQISLLKKRVQAEIEIKDEIRIDLLKHLCKNPSNDEIKLHLKLMKEEYLSDNSLKLCEDWCNKLLDLNNKSKVFSSKYLYELLKYSLIKAAKNNSLGGVSLEKNVLNFISSTILDGNRILELGSGMGTEALLDKFNVTSIEHDENFYIKRRENHDITLAPIKNNWYCKNSVQNVLKKNYALLIVDGPPRELRAGILKNLDLFKSFKAPIIFDDIDREVDRKTMEKFCDKLNYSFKIIDGEKKKFAYCTKNI